ncbi:MAG: hypothetical protein Q9227_008182 [Pyrenula ochraceoflavens]
MAKRMTMLTGGLLALLILGLGLLATVQAQSTDYTQYVLPFTGTKNSTSTGTENGGNMFPGVVRPFGVVKLGPDLADGTTDAYSGYLPSGSVTGFSLTHESGTGGAPKYGVVAQMPVTGNISNPLDDLSVSRASADEASVGYYKTSLSSGAVTELAATEHAGMLQYTFPAGSQANVVVDVSHVLPSFRGLGLGQNYTGGDLTITTNGSYTGSAPEWTIYFCGYFSGSPIAKTFAGSDTSYQYPGGSKVSAARTSDGSSQSIRVGAVFSFPGSNGGRITSRVGVSFISTAQACSNVNREIPKSASFQSVVDGTKEIWNTNVLSKVTSSTTDETSLQLLYTMLYGMHLLPSNKTHENPLWESSEPYYDDIFTLWDLHRCTTSLLQVLQPVTYEEYIRSLIDVYRHDGWMPDGRSSNFNGRSQGGSNADNVLADAYVKGVRGAVNWGDGYAAMVKDAEVQPPNSPLDPEAPDSSTHDGRGALPDWKQYGYITPTYTRSVNRAAEYALNDFSLYQVAKGLGNSADATKYLSRSRYWRNHWNANATSLGFSGFLAPRNADGSFVAEDPISCGGCYWGDYFYEATPWEYSFSPYHDMSTLISRCGGPSKFVNKLSTLFKRGLNPSGSTQQFGQTIFNPGNEPCFNCPYYFSFAGRQDLSVKQSRNVAVSYYSPTPGGLPGNSDAGAMQSWILWNMIGLYPLTGTTTFLIGSPWFGSLNINLGGGKSLKISSTGGGSSTENYYVQSLSVNGQSWNKSWLTWNDIFARGGTMDFVLGSQPTNWTTGPPPPSPAAGG